MENNATNTQREFYGSGDSCILKWQPMAKANVEIATNKTIVSWGANSICNEKQQQTFYRYKPIRIEHNHRQRHTHI